MHEMIYEVFTWPWLTELSQREGRVVTLADVPADDWDTLALPGVDTVWLMGVWERSPAGRRVALADPAVQAAVAEALPDATDADVVGSAYCIRDYRVDARLGGDEGLATARAALAERGLRLLLDYVPNHVASDHPWVEAHPEYFVRGSREDLERDPDAWLETAGGILAHGRDPYFPPWNDVLQLDPMSPGLRDAAAATLVSIAGRCDGVRCDMAMLVLDEVAERTWGERLSPRRPEPYWVEVTRRVRAEHPGFLLVAEAYWETEGRLFDEGIDACYDKLLYDRLVHDEAPAIRAHLEADAERQGRLVRFLENHDEPRAAAAFSPERGRAAAVALMTLPGRPLLNRGQLEGRIVRPPVQVGRAPSEPVDEEIASFWQRLLRLAADEGVRTGAWQRLEIEGSERLLAWRWARHVVIVNYGYGDADGLVQLGGEFAGGTWMLVDVYGDATYRRDGDELAGRGLYVRLGGYGAHVFRVSRA
jgi:hypothetical protein